MLVGRHEPVPLSRYRRQHPRHPPLARDRRLGGGAGRSARRREVLTGIGLNLAEAMPAMKLGRDRIEANDGQVEPEADFAAHRDEVIAALRELLALA